MQSQIRVAVKRVRLPEDLSNAIMDGVLLHYRSTNREPPASNTHILDMAKLCIEALGMTEPQRSRTVDALANLEESSQADQAHDYDESRRCKTRDDSLEEDEDGFPATAEASVDAGLKSVIEYTSRELKCLLALNPGTSVCSF